jgi:5-hydroxyisourate hydrolase
MSLSTHVLDTSKGRPAAGVALRLLRGDEVLFAGATDEDGRCPELKEIDTPPGCYRLEFAVADYFRDLGQLLPDPPFLDRITLEFGIAKGGGHYHVPLLVSPFSYSTYRGS